MSKGTPSMGKKQKKTHIICRRCGRHAYHAQHRECASCGFGRISHRRTYIWAKSH